VSLFSRSTQVSTLGARFACTRAVSLVYCSASRNARSTVALKLQNEARNCHALAATSCCYCCDQRQVHIQALALYLHQKCVHYCCVRRDLVDALENCRSDRCCCAEFALEPLSGLSLCLFGLLLSRSLRMFRVLLRCCGCTLRLPADLTRAAANSSSNPVRNPPKSE
jgi:hypothetical protein